MMMNQDVSGEKTLVKSLCLKYGVDEWHVRNSLRKPIYQRITSSIVARIARPESHIIEIGCGIGDILLLLYASGFKHITGIECDQNVYRVARDKIQQLETDAIHLICQQYPCILNEKPDIVLLINCIYFDHIRNAQQFAEELTMWMNFNGEPNTFLVELVDDSYTSLEHTRWKGQPTEFNVFCRVSHEQIRSFFPDYNILQIPSSEAYRVPKTVYLISKQDWSDQVGDLMHLL